MGRSLRIEYPDAFYHIAARGNEQKNIYRSDRDRKRFLGYLESAAQRYKAIIHTYCLMGNHYHLMLQTPAGNMSQIMQHINGAYTNYFNTKRKRSGHLFQGRYKAILVDADAYAQELSRYIHLNPVRAGIVNKPDEYEWSGYRYYINLKQPPQWIHTDFILGLFSQKATVARKQYRRFVESMVGCEYESPLKNIFASTVLGSRSFINQIRARHLDRKNYDRDLPDLKHFYEMPAIEEIVKGVEKLFGNDPVLSRRLKLYLCHRYSGRKLKEICGHFGIGESGVSQASRRVALQIKKDKKLEKCVIKIISGLNLSNV